MRLAPSHAAHRLRQYSGCTQRRLTGPQSSQLLSVRRELPRGIYTGPRTQGSTLVLQRPRSSLSQLSFPFPERHLHRHTTDLFKCRRCAKKTADEQLPYYFPFIQFTGGIACPRSRRRAFGAHPLHRFLLPAHYASAFRKTFSDRSTVPGV